MTTDAEIGLDEVNWGAVPDSNDPPVGTFEVELVEDMKWNRRGESKVPTLHPHFVVTAGSDESGTSQVGKHIFDHLPFYGQGSNAEWSQRNIKSFAKALGVTPADLMATDYGEDKFTGTVLKSSGMACAVKVTKKMKEHAVTGELEPKFYMNYRAIKN